MSTSKNKRRECSNPVRVLDKHTDEEQQDGLAQPSTGDNTVQLDFLRFLNTLDEVPNEITSAAHQAMLDVNVNVNPATLEVQFASSDLQPHLTHMPDLANQLADEADLSVAPQLQVPQEALLSHNFVQKLHMAAGSGHVPFLNWTPDGVSLQLDYLGLQEHLVGVHSMFRCRSVPQFTQQLLDLGFERVLQHMEDEDRPQLFYQHANFRAYHLEGLLRMATPRLEQLATPHSLNPCLSKGVIELDASASHQTCYSPLQLARFRFQALLHYHNDVRLLQEGEPNAEQLLPRRGRISSSKQPAQTALAPALASKHMNPRDSVLQFEAGKVPEYAGFYGRVQQTMIGEFFAEYLPRYGASTSGYKDIVVDASKANSFQQNLPIGIAYSEDEEDSGDQDSQRAAAGKHELAQPDDSFHPPPEDLELEQVMQELCGVGPDGEVDQEKKQPTPLKPKLKRKKLARKSAITEAEVETESANDDHGEDLLQAAAAAAAYAKDDHNASAHDGTGSGQCSEAKKDLMCSTSSKSVSKHRRYDLRNSKSKRSR